MGAVPAGMRQLLLALVASCACDVTYPGNRAVAVVLDPAFDRTLETPAGPATERDILTLGLHYWDGAGARFLAAEDAPCDAPRLEVQRVPANGAQGGAYHATGYITLDAWWGDEINDGDRMWMQSIFAHELGHAMGLQHVADENAVMAAWGGPLPAIDAADLAEYHARWQ